MDITISMNIKPSEAAANDLRSLAPDMQSKLKLCATCALAIANRDLSAEEIRSYATASVLPHEIVGDIYRQLYTVFGIFSP